jgi:hypothetical protein
MASAGALARNYRCLYNEAAPPASLLLQRPVVPQLWTCGVRGSSVLWSVEGSCHWVAFDGVPTGLVESGRDAECDEAVVRGAKAGVQAGSLVHGSDSCALRACVQASASGALLAVHLTTGPAFQQAELKAAPGSRNGPVVCVRLGQDGQAEVGGERGGWVGGGDCVGGPAGRWVGGSVGLRVGGPAGRWAWVGGSVCLCRLRLVLRRCMRWALDA